VLAPPFACQVMLPPIVDFQPFYKVLGRQAANDTAVWTPLMWGSMQCLRHDNST
jgi:hypothetical protein